MEESEGASVGDLWYLDAAEVARLCETVDPLQVVTDAFLAVRSGRGAVEPEAALRWSASDGTAARSLVLPARYHDSYGCKIINSCVGNLTRGLPRAHGLIVLFDPDTAAPVCIMEAARISALRTAAVSLAALLAVRDAPQARQWAFLGCGRQARTHVELFARHLPAESVVLYDTDAVRGAAFAEDVRQLVPGVSVTAVEQPEAAVRAADVTVAATTTTFPYVELEWLRPGSVFVNVSLDDASEELLIGCEHLFVDDWALVSQDDTRLLGRLAQRGRVSAPGKVAPPGGRQVDAELPDVLAGDYERPVTSTDRVAINPFGMGVHDIALASQVYEAARARGAGAWLPR